MKSRMPGDTEFDHAVRALHHVAGDSLSSNTRARLRTARQSAPANPSASRLGGRWPWLAASVASLVLLVALRVQHGPQGETGPMQAPPGQAEAGYEDEYESAYPSALAALDEDPDLYVWLANESRSLTLEQQ